MLRNRLAEATSFLEGLAIKDAMEKVGGAGEGAALRLVLPGRRCLHTYGASSPLVQA